MNIAIIVIGLIILAIVIFVLYRHFKVTKQAGEFSKQQMDSIKPLFDRLERGETLTQQDIYPFAKNLQTRVMTYKLLKESNKEDLFPTEFCTIIQAAQSNLANWLEFPTELNACPDEVEHIKRVTFDFDGQSHFVHYEVFKYRINEPHWAAKYGWIFGVVGPYFDDSKPYDHPSATFSKVNSINETTPEDEAMWVHDKLAKGRRK